MARPRSESPREPITAVRLSHDEKAFFQEAAARAERGGMPLSTFLRVAGYEKAESLLDKFDVWKASRTGGKRKGGGR